MAEKLPNCYDDEDDHCSKCLDEDHDDHIDSEICCLCWEKANRGQKDFELEKIEEVHDVDLEGDSVIIFDMENQMSLDRIEAFKDKLEDAGLDREKAVIVSGLNNLFELRTGDEDVEE